jgi:hypothetical protein
VVSRSTVFETHPSKRDMEDMAWIIRTKDINRKVGFASEGETSEDGELEIVPSE